ncbi:MAG TPA: protoporphyrinogen oxidase [Pirellulales bacterium]|jgi:oxygen-dependent protoporphyrinogen oxidase|nr:protoporphyrinogen oxidase [Pirellulales bacterium]
MEDQSSQPRQVAIVGGGIAGLAAAHRVKELSPQAAITLFETSPRLGGIIRTVRQDDFLIEQSADSFITTIPAAINLCRRIGFAEQLIPMDSAHRGAMVVARGKLQHVPDGFVLMSPQRLWPLLRSPILSWRGKLRAACERFIPSGGNLGDESVADFARRRLGQEAFERLVQPLVGGIYTANPETLSLEATLPRYLEMERKHGSLRRAARSARKPKLDERNADAETRLAEEDSGARYSMFVAPRDGLESFVNAIADRLPNGCVRLSAKIERIERENGRWSVVRDQESGVSGQLAPGSTGGQYFDGVILATPASVSAKLLGGMDGELARELSEIESAGTVIVALAYDREQITNALDSFGFVVPAIERRKILSASYSSVKFPGRAPAGKVLIRVFLGGALQPEMLTLSDDQLLTTAKEELRALLGIRGGPSLSLVFRWPASMPQYQLGHIRRLQSIRQRLEQHPGLALAGNAFEGVGIPQCIQSGEAAAESVIKNNQCPSLQ